MSKPELCVCGHDKDNHILGKEPWQNGCTVVRTTYAASPTMLIGEPCDCLGWNPVVQV